MSKRYWNSKRMRIKRQENKQKTENKLIKKDKENNQKRIINYYLLLVFE